MLYKHAAMPDSVDPEERTLKTVNEVSASDGGKGTLFAKDIVQATEITNKLLTFVMPYFRFQSFLVVLFPFLSLISPLHSHERFKISLASKCANAFTCIAHVMLSNIY
jgi:hypothetical protein